MKNKNILLIAIAVLVVALIAVGAYTMFNGNTHLNVTDNTTGIDNSTGIDNNTTVVGDNSPLENLTNNNTTYKVYNPQSDSYVPVIGEKFDEEVNRWYTYDDQGVRYYNTRIN
ncbi:hypothetical protein SAMN05216439_0170 [Methanobrevibacter gottschalkii]|uniref:Uncharacterized protein n=2 Tax=Methanobrevibacter gottschalkii TaxID=190974 RepID=A0A3N5B3M1_9EURY|nr:MULTISPECIES: hypothetical protein [Methanobrevibacter]MCQ2970784.1 hypothetical protein [archaeon]OEC97281.1 hypothetical protein A9505_05555 [Methanobrevibacter sp. A27]RPF51994.1 hypothetical protein EDC42_1338 [Methanobrevibacter gottschalkii DSM 11977]SEL21341.1 hypothetical protein SAMN05216439_0170 [Methanobrevibacter gottschalkii]